MRESNTPQKTLTLIIYIFFIKEAKTEILAQNWHEKKKYPKIAMNCIIKQSH
jgi:hypothetical protein